MNITLKNLSAAIGVAIFVAHNMFMCVVLTGSESPRVFSFSEMIEAYFLMLFMFFVFGGIVTLIAFLLIGLPLYFVARFFKKINIYTVVGGAVFTALTPLFLCLYNGWNLHQLNELDGLLLVVAIALCGGVGGLTFWKLQTGVASSLQGVR